MNIFQAIKKLISYCVTLWRPKVEPPVEPPVAAAVTEQLKVLSPNRATRRALERRRRRHDKFLAKQKLGEKSVTTGTVPSPPKVQVPVVEFKDPNDLIIADDLYGDGNVLIEETEFYGQFNFRDSILEQLDRYWVYLERMRKGDNDAYELYRQVGAIIVPYSADNLHHLKLLDPVTDLEKYRSEINLPTWFLKQKPAFGCLVVGANPITEKWELSAKMPDRRVPWLPKFMYFCKYQNPPPSVQPMSGGDVYSMTVYWDRPHDPVHKKRKWGSSTEFCVFIDHAGQIQVLKTCDTRLVKIRAKHGKDRGTHFSIPQRAWHIPDDYCKWAADFGLTPELHLAHLFCTTVKKFEMANYSPIRINVHKGSLTAVFSVNPSKTAYFFRDRDVVINQDGVKQRIFHQVSAHERQVGERTTPVRPHFRGLKEFNWAGYQVQITVQGKDHTPVQEFNAGVTDEYWFEEGEKYSNMKDLGKLLAREIRGRK